MPGRNTISRKLPAARDNSIIVEENQSFGDIMSVLLFMHGKNKSHYDKISGQFVGADLRETCENLFDFCKNYIPYEIETEDLQTIKTPQRILSDSELGVGHDCKHFASFIAGNLDALRRQGQKINWCFRFASYQLFDTTPGHVFVVVKSREGEIWIDPVLSYFDERKKYNYSIDKCNLSSIGCNNCGPDSVGRVGAVVGGRDNQTAATLQTVGGTICAVGGSIAACIPAGTVVAAVVEVVGFAVSFIGKLFASSYAYSTNVDWLCQKYQRGVLSDPNAIGNHITTGLLEKYVPASQLWFATVLGVPCWDQLRWHALRGTNPADGKPLLDIPGLKFLSHDLTDAGRIKAYKAFGAVEAAVPDSAILAAIRIAKTMDDTPTVGEWRDYPPANIVIQCPGCTAEEVVEQAAGDLTGKNPGGVPVHDMFTLVGSPYLVPILIAAGAGILIITNKKNR